MRLSDPAVVDPEIRFDVDGGLETVATSTPSGGSVRSGSVWVP
jgi:hypothetical protein